MYRSRWRRTPVLVALAMATAASLAACGGGSPADRVNAVGATASAGTVVQAGPVTAGKLAGALLTRINGESPTAPAASGSYDSLPQVKAVERQGLGGTGVPPRPCAQAALTGLQSGALGTVPAAAVSFRVGRNGVSEMLAAPSRTVADAVLRRALPSACAHERVSAGGEDFRYTAREENVTGIGEQARVLSVRSAGRSADDIWSVVFRGEGFIGSITVVGPDASELAVRELGMQAYGFAAKSLSS